MSQTATINATTDSAKLASSRVAEAARSGAEGARKLTKDFVAQGTAAAERQGAQMRDATQATVATANRGGAELAAFWLKVMQEQTAQNIDAMRRLAGAQTWEEKLAVQGSFLSDSLARMQDVFTRYLELTGTMTDDMLATRTGDDDKAS